MALALCVFGCLCATVHGTAWFQGPDVRNQDVKMAHVFFMRRLFCVTFSYIIYASVAV